MATEHEKYPHLSPATIYKAKRKRATETNFDYDGFLKEAEGAIVSRQEATMRNELKVAQKLGKVGATVRFNSTWNQGSYSRALLDFTFTLQKDESIRQQMFLCDELANDIINDIPEAIAYAQAFEENENAVEELCQVSDREFLRALNEDFPDITKDDLERLGYSRDSPASDFTAPYIAKIQETQDYLSSLGKISLTYKRASESFLLWKSKADKESVAPREFLAPIQVDIFGETHNSHAMALLMRGVSLPSEWETNREEGFKYLETLKGVFKYQPKELEPWLRDTIETAIALLEKRFVTIKSDILADTIEILFHHWKTYPYPKQRDKVRITPAQICEYRGIKPTGDNLKNAWQALRDARAIFLRACRRNERIIGDCLDAARPQSGLPQ